MARRTLAAGVLSLAACLALTGCFLLPNRAPVAAFAPIYNVDPEAPMVVLLDASASADPDEDPIVTYQWAFGDDDITFPEPEGTSRTTSEPALRIRCPNEGTYDVTLVVWDDGGLPSTPLVGTITVPHAAP